MPNPLPPLSGFTIALEISSDASLIFSKTNFLQVRLTFIILAFSSILAGDVHVFNRRANIESEIKTMKVPESLWDTNS